MYFCMGNLKIVKILITVFLSLLLLGCVSLTPGIYERPIPIDKEYFIQVKIYALSTEEFRDYVAYYFGEDEIEWVVGFTLLGKPLPVREVYIPILEDGSIDLETLGHEIFYHVMHDMRH